MKSILIVEDDITFSLMLQKWLTKHKFSVTCVSSIADAKQNIKKNSYHLILSDMRLPDSEGVDLLEWINRMDSQIPLIIMTSYADIQSAVPAMRQNRCVPVSGAVRRGHDDFLVALPAARYIVISSDF